jgi:hypothetical protein
MKFKIFIKILLGALATILLGAIGSGVWERLLSPALKETSNFITSTISSISKTYSDSIYSRASSITTYDQSENILLILLFVVFFALFIYAINSKKDNPRIARLHRAMVGPFQGWAGGK